jgi:uncharacterized protein YbjT (DUF2867 family)
MAPRTNPQSRQGAMNPRDILILGGTGFVGRSVCAALVERSGSGSIEITVPSRHPERAKHLQLLPTVRLVAADVHDEARLAALVRGSDAVVNLIAILHGSQSEFERAHVALPRTLARVCAVAGVRRVIHVSSLGVAADAPSRYLRSKAAGEAVLATAGLDLSVLRPSVMFGEHDRFMNTFARLQALLPVMPLAGAAARFQPVWVQDVAAAIVRCLEEPATFGKTYECAGPEVYTLRQLVEAAGRWSGHPRPVLALPDALARLQALLMEWLPGETLLSRDNLDSMRVPNIASGRLPGLQALGIAATSLAAVVPDYLAPGRGLARLDQWRAARRG